MERTPHSAPDEHPEPRHRRPYPEQKRDSIMSREVRPVALDWEHPRNPGTYSDGRPRYIPLYSRDALRHHLEYNAEHPDDDEPIEIDLDDYMPEIPEGTPYGWQLYQTVSEGSPVSPVFATKELLAGWLSSPAAGRDQVAPDVAARFVAEGWAPSFYSSPETGFVSGVEWVGSQS
jgi:hypothetical protein